MAISQLDKTMGGANQVCVLPEGALDPPIPRVSLQRGLPRLFCIPYSVHPLLLRDALALGHSPFSVPPQLFAIVHQKKSPRRSLTACISPCVGGGGGA